MAKIMIDSETRGLLISELEVQASGLGDFAIDLRHRDRSAAVRGRSLLMHAINVMDDLEGWDDEEKDVDVEIVPSVREWLIRVRHDLEALLGQAVIAEVDHEQIDESRRRVELVTDVLMSLRPAPAEWVA